MNVTAEKYKYVESLNGFLAPLQDFDYIKYARTPKSEYVKIADTLGGYVFLDVTGAGLDTILDNVAQIVRHELPMNAIVDRPVLRKIAPLFR